jgi:hypothetical protein
MFRKDKSIDLKRKVAVIAGGSGASDVQVRRAVKKAIWRLRVLIRVNVICALDPPNLR